jgi:hypothetical protein
MSGVKSINIFSELDRLKVQWVAATDDEIRFCCPVHEDKTPSASLNVKEHTWKCFVPSCGASGDFVSLLAYFLKSERRVVLADLQLRYPDIGGVSTIPSQTVEKFHAALLQAGPLLGELKKRGVTPEMMRVARLGFHEGRITIPVYNTAGQCVNVRRYLPGAPGPQKMRNTTGHGQPQLYRAEMLQSARSVLICGGEMKALVAGSMLEPMGIAAVASTGGEGHWKDDWTALLKDRDVYICMDIDDAGVAASRRIAVQLYSRVRSIKVIKLPLDKNVHPKGDINDWVGQCNATGEDLASLIEKTPEWAPPQKQAPSTAVVERIELDKAITQGTVGKKIEVHAVVAAADQTPFLVPREIDVECTRDQPGCVLCPIQHLQQDESGWARVNIDPASPAILGMLAVNEREQVLKISSALGVPPCKTVKYHTRSHHIVHDVRLSPPMDITGNRVGDAWYPAMIVGQESAELNVPCRMRGCVHPHPKTQQAVALIDELEELEDTLSSYHPSEEDIVALREVFQPAFGDPEGLRQKLNSIYVDLESNVTWIYRRRDMHLAYDLAWHSPLMFKFGGRQTNGWVNLLVIGDSAQGKSEAVSRLMAHYGCGDKVDCKNATVAGLLGGLEQLGNRWFVRWGAIPARDRTLVILEELKGAPVEVLSKLTDMRSSGIAELPKIERRRALARTRLIMLSNPRTPRPMASFHFGVEAIHELIGALEDVRRFDLAVAVGRGEVPDDIINMMPSSREKVEHKATAELCKKLVLWAWTRKPDQILIGPDTTDAIVKVAIELCAKYSEAIPLVDQGTIRLKVARLAAALAARTFSTPDGHMLVVQPWHVDFISSYLERVYSSPVMGYAEFSIAQKLMAQVQDPAMVAKAIRGTRHPADLASVLLSRDTISLEDIMSAGASDIDTARALLSLLVRKGALLRSSRTEYAKNPEFIAILKGIRNSSAPQHDTTGDEF